MYFECVAIIALIVAMSFLFIRRGKKNIAFSMIPLLFVPGVHAIFGIISAVFLSHLGFSVLYYNIFVDILALIISGIFIGLISSGFKKRKSGYIFCAVCGGFTFLLTSLLLIKMLGMLNVF